VVESFFALSRKDQREALEYGRSETGCPVHLLEKDLWVVWTLRALFYSPLSSAPTLKGGTSLSKVYKVITRFSEDLDLTCDIRTLTLKSRLTPSPCHERQHRLNTLHQLGSGFSMPLRPLPLVFHRTFDIK